MSTQTVALISSKTIHSMTGFARISGRVSDTLAFTLSLKGVNHRFLDLHMRIPNGAESLEMKLRRLLKERLVRGHVEVTLNLERSTRVAAQYDRAQVEAYVASFRAAAADFSLSGEPDLNAILRMPGVLTSESSTSLEDMEQLEAAVLAQMDAVLEAFSAMRAQEGAALTRELLAGMDRLRSLVEEIGGQREGVQQAYFEKVSQRLSALLNGSFEPERVLQEAALLAERSDVQEEITRMLTHVEHFQSMLQAGGEVGKKLDFLLQEMNREANTLLSKTGGVAGNGPRITELGLGLKSEIEKAREQVQNLE